MRSNHENQTHSVRNSLDIVYCPKSPGPRFGVRIREVSVSGGSTVSVSLCVRLSMLDDFVPYLCV